MNTYSILWLEDEQIKELSDIEKEYPNFKIQQVIFMDVCERLLTEHSSDYHAVILDANGLKSDQVDRSPNKSGFINLVKLAKEKELPVYVYSGQIIRGVEESEITLEFLQNEGFHENINLFYKSGGSDPLMERINKDLEQEYHIFYKYPIIHDNVLHYGVNKNAIKELLLWMSDKENHKFPVMSELRSIIYDKNIYPQVKHLLGIDKDGSINFEKRNNKEICIEDWQVPIVNFLLKKLLNANTHNSQSDNEYLQVIVANSVIVTMEWYNRFMHKFGDKNITIPEVGKATIEVDTTQDLKPVQIKDNTPEGIVVQDETFGYYLVNDKYIIPPKLGRRYLNRKVRITKHFRHMYSVKVEPIDD